jgi:hypothetical protein
VALEGTAMINHQPDAAGFRRWAMECSVLADDPRNSKEERERYLKIRDGLLEMAKTQDWLDGQPPMRPPVQSVPELRWNFKSTTNVKWS